MARWLAILLLQALILTGANAATEYRKALVAEPYMELHSGPGVGYPVVYTVERGATVEIVKRRTDWFYVRTERGIEGWVAHDAMFAAQELSGQPLDIHEPTQADYTSRRWEGGALAGRFDGASIISLFVTYGFSDHLSGEVTISHELGDVSNSVLGTLGLNHTFAPEWRISPYFGLGTGIIKTSPQATLVATHDRIDQIGYADIGVRSYLSRRLVLRAEYRANVVFTKGNSNEDINEWKLGFAFFF